MIQNQAPKDPIRAPRGTGLSCKGWHQEAAMRMLMNNLDPEVGERPQDLVVYGGTGKAARNWDCYYRIVESLKALENDETLLVQSGKPVGIFRTHTFAPRVLISNAMLVPAWGNWEKFRELEELGLTMYGQMTAGSWIYIGTQGILQGTYETFAAAARKHFGGSLRGRLVLTAGLGGMGGAQPLSVTMNDGVILAIEVDPKRIEKRVKTGYCEVMTTNLDEALDLALTAKQQGIPKSIGLVGNAAEVHPEILRRGILPDLMTDQTSAHDALNGYVPAGFTLEEARDLRVKDPQEYINRAMDSMALHVQTMLDFQKRGAIVFDYGNNIRAQAMARGVKNAFDFPGFVPAFVRPLFCTGRGPFRWAVLSGDPADIARIDDVVLREFNTRNRGRWQLLQLLPHRLPASGRTLAPRRGRVHRLVGQAERCRQDAPGLPSHAIPEVGRSLPSPRDPGRPAGADERVRREPHAGRHGGKHGGEGGARARALGVRRHGLPNFLHEGRRPEDPLVGRVRLPPPAEGGHGRPAAEAPDQPPALELRAPALRHALRYEGPVGGPRPAGPGGEVREDRGRRLPRAGRPSHERAVPTPGVPVERREGGDHAGAERVQVEVADEFEQVPVLLHHDRFVAVLEEVAGPLVPAVERASVPGEQGPQIPAQRAGAGPDEKVGVIREEGPGVDGQGAGGRERRQPGEEIRPVGVVPKDRPPFDPTHHHVVEDARGIEARLAGHERKCSIHCTICQRPLFLFVAWPAVRRRARPKRKFLSPNGVAGEEPAHEARESSRAAAEEDVGMVREERPGVDIRVGRQGHVAKPRPPRPWALATLHWPVGDATSGSRNRIPRRRSRTLRRPDSGPAH